MKKFVAIVLSGVLMLSTTACGNNSDFDGEVLVARMEMNEEQLEEYVETNGFDGYEIVDEEYVKIQLSEEARDNMLLSIKSEIDTAISNTVDDKTFMDISKIEYNDDFSEINMFVSKDNYDEFMSMLGFGFVLVGYQYQSFMDIPEEEMNINFNILDTESNEELYTTSLQAMLEEFSY